MLEIIKLSTMEVSRVLKQLDVTKEQFFERYMGEQPAWTFLQKMKWSTSRVLVEKWNKLSDEIVMVESVQKFKIWDDNRGSLKDEALISVQLPPNKVQIGYYQQINVCICMHVLTYRYEWMGGMNLPIC